MLLRDLIQEESEDISINKKHWKVPPNPKILEIPTQSLDTGKSHQIIMRGKNPTDSRARVHAYTCTGKFHWKIPTEFDMRSHTRLHTFTYTDCLESMT